MASPESTELLEKFVNMEEHMWDARVKPDNETTWRELIKQMLSWLSDDCVIMLPDGVVLTSTTTPSFEDVLQSPDFLCYNTFDITNASIAPIGNDGVVLSYHAFADIPPKKPKQQIFIEVGLICTSVWRKDGDTYKMCSHHQSVLPDTVLREWYHLDHYESDCEDDECRSCPLPKFEWTRG